ncbi:MAG: hypothetical protein RL226_631 [Bacteroidota bacterium]|jgi:hypothetical protein
MAAAPSGGALDWRDSIFHAAWPMLALFGFIFLWAEMNHMSISFGGDYFDAEHYLAIAHEGYTELYQAAFFPGYPLLLKLFHANAIGAVLLNILLWGAGRALLLQQGLISKNTSMLSAVVPAALFYYLPYSEALFFMAGGLVAIGLKHDDNRFLLPGLLLAVVTRPTSAILIPALFIARVLKGYQLKNAFMRTLPEALLSLVMVAIVFVYQSIYTGDVFSFFEAQKGWGNQLGSMGLPLFTWGGDLILLLDSLSLWISLMSAILLIYLYKQKHPVSTPHAFGLAALAFTGLLVVLSRNGGIFSLNRFIFATVFLPLALELVGALRNDKKLIWLAAGSFLLTVLVCGGYVHIRILGWFLLTGALMATYVYMLRQPSVTIRTGFAVLCIAFQAWFFTQIVLQGNWLG